MEGHVDFQYDCLFLYLYLTSPFTPWFTFDFRFSRSTSHLRKPQPLQDTTRPHQSPFSKWEELGYTFLKDFFSVKVLVTFLLLSVRVFFDKKESFDKGSRKPCSICSEPSLTQHPFSISDTGVYRDPSMC